MWLQRCLHFSKWWYYCQSTSCNTSIITNCAQFTKWITKIDGRIIDDAESLDLVLPICNLIEYSLNYCEKPVSLCFHSNDEATGFNANVANTDDLSSIRPNY